jgi:RHS repeat-associated protein
MTLEFDYVGNRTSSHRSSTYGIQPFNKLISTATADYGYDANGNMTSKGEGSNFWRYTWDYENRMGSASTRKQTVRYKYDALGRRVQRAIAGGKENTKFTYDGQDVLVDDNSGTLTKYLNGGGIDNKLRTQTASTVNYFLGDHLGSTNGLADSTGALTASTTYDSFGNATNASFPSRYQFTGREFDNFTGQHYYRARFYDANLGRFISEDPIGFSGGDINLYGYVGNHPTMFRDPSGKIIPAILFAGVAITVLILASPSPVNAPGPTSPIYYPDNPLLLNAAGGAVCSALLSKVAAPFVGRLLGGMGDDIIELGISRGPAIVPRPFKPFTAGNFRNNLGEFTGEIPPNVHAHHVFPREFADDFLNAGINPHKPQYGAWWESGSHLKNAYKYNADWGDFLQQGPTQQQIFDFGRQMMSSHGIPVNY